MADIKDRAREYIAELSKHIVELQKDKGELIDRCRELEARIEKMKCCENCNNFMHRIDHRCNTKCKNLSEWEIKEND